MNLRIFYVPEKSKNNVKSKFIAVYHGVIKLYARKYNVERAKNVIKIARASNARLLILPPYFNTGPVLEYSDPSLRKYISRLFEQTTDSSIRAMRNIALMEDIDIVVSCFLEKSGAYYYITSLLIDRDGVIMGRYRKIVLTNIEMMFGIHSGKSIGLMATPRIKVGALINNEVIVPELARALGISGINLFVIPVNPLDYSYSVISTVGRTRAIENLVPVVLAGSVVEYHDEILSCSPTIIYDHEGNKVFEYNEPDPALILIEQRFLLGDTGFNPDVIESIYLHKIVSKYIKRLHKELYERIIVGQSDKTSSSIETEPAHHPY